MDKSTYNHYLKIVKQHDKMPYEDIILVEALIKTKHREKHEDFTPNELYEKYLSKIMDREIFNAIIKYFRITGRIHIERDNGYIVWLWDTVSIEKREKEKNTYKKSKHESMLYLQTIN